MAESKLKPYADLKVKTREYVDREGKAKSVYQTIGTLFSSPHGSHMTIKLDVVPIGDWNGWISVFKREDQDRPITQNEVLEIAGEFTPNNKTGKVDLSEIPF